MSDPAVTVLVVEDDRQMRRFLRATLTALDYRVLEAQTLEDAMTVATTHNPDVILLDLGMPDGDGIDYVRRIRSWNRVPVIVLSARGREEDKVAALDAGADDYLTKPFGVNELLARIRASLRRSAAASAGSPPAIIEIGRLRIDQARRETSIGGREIRLTPIEYRLLVYLASNAGKVLTHRQILAEVWGPPYAGESHNLRVFMAALRRKVEEDPARPRLLLTEPGVGYRMKDA